MHEPLEQERRNGVCLHCLTPSNIHGSLCPYYWKGPIDRTAKPCCPELLKSMDSCSAALNVGHSFPGPEQEPVPNFLKVRYNRKPHLEPTEENPTTTYKQMARYNSTAVQNRQRQSIAQKDNGEIRKYILHKRHMPGLEYLRSVSNGTAPAVFHTSGNSEKSDFRPGLGHTTCHKTGNKTLTTNWWGIGSRVDSQENLVDGEVYDQQRQASNLLEITYEGLTILRQQNHAFHLLLSDIEFRHPGLYISRAALLRQSADSSTRFGLHQDTRTPKSKKTKLSKPIRTVIVNINNGGSGIKFAGMQKNGFGSHTYTTAGMCIDFCSNLWHESEKPPNAKQVDLKFTVFLSSKF